MSVPQLCARLHDELIAVSAPWPKASELTPYKDAAVAARARELTERALATGARSLPAKVAEQARTRFRRLGDKFGMVQALCAMLRAQVALGRSAAAQRSMATRLFSTSSSVVAHELTLMRIAGWPCHTVPPHQHVPSDWIEAIVRCVVSASPNDTSTWFSTTSFSTR